MSAKSEEKLCDFGDSPSRKVLEVCAQESVCSELSSWVLLANPSFNTPFKFFDVEGKKKKGGLILLLLMG